MVEGKDKVKLIVAIIAFLAAGALIAWQFIPAKGQAASSNAQPEIITTTKDKDGSVVTRQGGRAMREMPNAK